MISPLVSFPSYDAFEEALREEIQGERRLSRRAKQKKAEEIIAEVRRLREMGLPPIASAPAFGRLFGVSPKLITAMATRPIKYWRTFEIPKKAGGSRTITAPRAFLKTVQTYILQTILAGCPEHQCAFGFSKGKGAIANAHRHLHQPYVWNTDIVNFFPTIRLSQVHEVFSGLGFRQNVSWILASLCTYKGVLPQGAPSSPKLSNIICLQLDLQLQELAENSECIYTRYADDITFSSKSPIPEAVSLLSKEWWRRPAFD